MVKRRMDAVCNVCFAAGLAVLITPGVSRAFDPANGDWGKSDPKHIRIMTYNIEDGIGPGQDTAPASPTTFGSQFDYIGRICQAMDPDVICFQESEPANNPPASVSATENAFENWVSTYFSPGAYNIYVSNVTDGFNRNVTLSKYPFVDLNGDGVATNASWSIMLAGPGGLPPGGSVPIRGWNQTEIDLPDNIYVGDLFVGNSHFKAGGSSSDFDDRLEAGQNIAYWINEAYNEGQNTGGDPQNLLIVQPPDPLDDNTPVVLCGDFNEDESSNGRDGPVKWLADWTNTAGDGTDRDDSTMDRSHAIEPLDGSDSTRGSNTLDYILIQDSIATVEEKFIFKSSPAADAGVLPPQLDGLFFAAAINGFASDHDPVIADISLPLLPSAPGDCDGDGDVDEIDFDTCFEPCLFGIGGGLNGNCSDADLDDDGDVTLADYRLFQSAMSN